MNFSGKVKNFLIVILLLVVGFAAGFSVATSPLFKQGASPTIVNNELGTASLMLDYGDGRVITYDNIPVDGQKNLFEVLDDLTKIQKIAFGYKEYSGLGNLITKISDKTNGAENRYWQYWVNNKYSSVGASSYIVKPGDIIEWKFTKGQE